jgi:hypothetical protein
MTSLRKLRRRVLRWRRYDRRYCRGQRGWASIHVKIPPGMERAAKAVEREDFRRFWAEQPETWLGGPAGEAALIAAGLHGPPWMVTEHGLEDAGLL